MEAKQKPNKNQNTQTNQRPAKQINPFPSPLTKTEKDNDTNVPRTQKGNFQDCQKKMQGFYINNRGDNWGAMKLTRIIMRKMSIL